MTFSKHRENSRINRVALLLTMSFCACNGGKSPQTDTSPGSRTGNPVTMNPDNSGLFIAPASESAARAAAVLPTKASEDVSHLLGKIEIPAPPKVAPGKEEYLPNENVEWVLTVEFDGDPRLDPKTVSGVFDKAWRDKFGSFSAHGRDADSGRWTYLISADGPTTVTKLKFAWDFENPIERDAAPSTEAIFEQRIIEVSKKLNQFGKPKVVASMPTAEAAVRAKKLRELKAAIDVSAVLILKAPKGQRFDGKTIWDVMLCLGLKWGDMDCFHWENSSREGDDHFFSVETSTSPGYFLPEPIAAGKVQVEDLVFVFSIPRCREPSKVFDSMVKAVQYCQRRLNGQITDEGGAPADLKKIKARIAETERRLREAGLEPGRDAAMRLF